MKAEESILHSLRILLTYHRRLKDGVWTDIRQRYAGSVLGLAWAVLYPMILLTIYSTVYVFIFKVRPQSLDEYQYLVLVFSGLTPLLAFSETLMTASSSLTANRSLLLNTVFPAELIPVRAVLAAQVPSLMALLLTLIGGYAMGLTGWTALVSIPVLWILLVLFVCGISWVLSLLNLILRDIQQGLGLVLMLMMILSPFAYTPDMVPANLKLLLYFNPMSYFVLSFQQVVCYGNWPSVFTIGPAAAIAFTAFFGGFWMFRRTKYVFFDNV